MNASEAALAAADARKEGLLGKYPLAAQILAEEVFRLRGEVEAERKACANVCAALRDEWARLKVGAKDGRYEMMEEAASVCEDEILGRTTHGKP